MARLETLPYELLSEITSLLPYPALAALCLTSRALYVKANPLLWRHLQFGPAIPRVFGDRLGVRVSSAQSPPYLRLSPTANDKTSSGASVRFMGLRDILKFYTAARKNWIRDETFELVRSIELRDGVLGGCLEPFDNVGWWMNGEFHAVFKDIVGLGKFDGLTSIRIVYDRSPNLRRDISGTELKAVQKAQDFCRTLGKFAVTHPDVRVKISTTQFSLVHALFSETPPPSTITSLKTTLIRRPAMIELFSVHVLPNLQRSLQDLTILTSGLDGGTPRHLVVSLFDEYSGEYYPYVGYTFDDETEFSRLSFPALRSVEYAAELFGFVWVPEGIKSLCVRHSTVPEVRWWKELAAKEMKDLESLEVWIDCEILSYNSTATGGIRPNEVNYWSRWTEVTFKDLKSLIIASNSSHFSGRGPNPEAIEGEIRPGNDNITGVPLDITRAIVTANPQLQDVFVECIDSQGLATLLSRGKVRSLTIQNCWGVDTQRRYCFPFSVDSLAAVRNCCDLEWLQFCVRDVYGGTGILRSLVELLAVYCRKLRSFVMEDQWLDAMTLEVDERFPVVETEVTETGEVRDLGRWIRPMRPGEMMLLPGFGGGLEARDGFFVFNLEGFREGWGAKGGSVG